MTLTLSAFKISPYLNLLCHVLNIYIFLKVNDFIIIKKILNRIIQIFFYKKNYTHNTFFYNPLSNSNPKKNRPTPRPTYAKEALAQTQT